MHAASQVKTFPKDRQVSANLAPGNDIQEGPCQERS